MGEPRSRDEIVTVGVVSVGHFLSHFYQLVFPPLFPLLRAEFGYSNTQLGILVSAIAVGTLLQIPVGELVDHVGAKWVFVVGLAVTALGVTLSAAANSYVGLVAFALLSGIGQSSFHPADYPLLESNSPPDRMGRNFSIHTFSGYVGFAAAPVLVGTSSAMFGWRSTLLGAGAVGVAYAAVSGFTLGTSYRKTAAESEAGPAAGRAETFFNPAIVAMLALFMMLSMASKGIMSFTPLLAVDGFSLTDAVGNTALTAFFSLTAVGVLVGGVLADRADPRRVILGAMVFASGLLWITVSGVLPVGAFSMIVLFAAVGGSFGLVFASRDKLVSTMSADGSTGRSFGFVFTGSAIGSLVSPALLGYVADVSTIALAFGFAAAFFFVAGLIATVIGRGPLQYERQPRTPMSGD